MKHERTRNKGRQSALAALPSACAATRLATCLLSTCVATCLVAACLLAGCAQSANQVELPEGFPQITAEGESSVEGGFITTFNGMFGHYLAKMDERGAIAWTKKVGDPAPNTVGRATNPKKVEPQAAGEGAGTQEVAYFYFERASDWTRHNSDSEMVFIDAEGNELDRVRYRLDAAGSDEAQLDQSEQLLIDPHDAIAFDTDSYIVSACREEHIENIPPELNPRNVWEGEVAYIQEVENGQVKWQFCSSDYPQFYATKADHESEFDNFQDDFSDYMHFNSMAIDPADGNLLVSFRNQCSIVKLNRETGEPMWVLGGKGDEFNLEPEARFECQHSISFTGEGKLLVYDNRIEGEESRILVLSLDEQAKTAEIVRSIPLGVDTVTWGQVEEIAADVYLVNTGDTSNLDVPQGFFEMDAVTGERSLTVSYLDSADSHWVHKG